jgi:hypothetical protein
LGLAARAELLELGSGGGNNALHMKTFFRLTLSDLSPGMLSVSRALNPECEHVAGDMRTLRLSRTFDGVLVHDAIMYMTTEEDLRAAMVTARTHLRSGGVALFVPDCVRETFEPRTHHGGHDGEGRGLRYLEWTHDADPIGTTFDVDFAILLAEQGKAPRLVHDPHRFGLFSRATWMRLLAEAGLTPRVVQSFEGDERDFFVGVRPAGREGRSP